MHYYYVCDCRCCKQRKHFEISEDDYNSYKVALETGGIVEMPIDITQLLKSEEVLT